MPRVGRPRLVASKASGTKLFVDDLREVVKLMQVEERKTMSDVIRELVHEALVTRRQRAMGRDEEENHLRRIHQQAISAGISPLELQVKEIGQTLNKFALGSHHPGDPTNGKQGQIQTLLTEILGFAMTAEMKAHLLLQNFLLSRGLSEEAAAKMLTEHEEKSRQRTEKIIIGLMQSQS